MSAKIGDIEMAEIYEDFKINKASWVASNPNGLPDVASGEIVALKWAIQKERQRCAKICQDHEISIPMVTSVSTEYHERQMEKMREAIAEKMRCGHREGISSPWIDFRDRRPADGQEILVWWRHEEPEFENEPHWCAMTARKLPSEPRIYFWQPVPAPPTPEQIAAAAAKQGGENG